MTAGQRRALWYLVPGLALALLAAVAVAVVRTSAGADDDEPSRPGRARCAAPSPAPGLRALAVRCGIFLGTAVSEELFHDTTYQQMVAREYNSVTPESAMKWGTVEAHPGEFDFGPGDAFVDAAHRNGQRVRGHTLVWHKIPAWVTDGDYPRDRLREILQRHVETTAAHWRGRVVSWDVVNEPVSGDGELRDSVWLRGLGPDYIADAFHWARAADPDAVLFVNEYGVEGINPKSDRLYELVKSLRAQGVPIDGVGFQAHLVRMSLPDSFEENLRRFAELGVQIAITEMDVRMPLPATPEKLATQAALYARALRACLELPACQSFTTWGFTDRLVREDPVFPGEGAALPFDEAYQPKPAYWALRDTLAAASPRR